MKAGRPIRRYGELGRLIRPQWFRPGTATAIGLGIVLGSVMLFGLVVNKAGLVIATLLLVLVSSTASHEYRWRESIVAAIALAVFVVVAFRYGLGLQLPTWPPALTG
jgi:hypothetical protein